MHSEIRAVTLCIPEVVGNPFTSISLCSYIPEVVGNPFTSIASDASPLFTMASSSLIPLSMPSCQLTFCAYISVPVGYL